jgi:hypothetical protein
VSKMKLMACIVESLLSLRLLDCVVIYKELHMPSLGKQVL